MDYIDEDIVRDNAKITLGFDDNEKNVRQGTGQNISFSRLDFKGNGKNKKPDGWYLPSDTTKVAIIYEAKSSRESISNPEWIAELQRNMIIAAQRYKRIIGILHNGVEQNVFKLDRTSMNHDEEITRTKNVPQELQHKSYYLALFNENKIDKKRIYEITKKINNELHFQFGIKNLYHRMIFTACALVARRFDAKLIKGMSYPAMKSEIEATLKRQPADNDREKSKISILLEVYNEIKMNNPDNQEAIDNFISWVCDISDCVNSDYWNGEDVMGIFFNEFNRYRPKSESGQVFTPDHITSFMYRLIDVNKEDRILDATCGSGAFLVKAMCNMIKEAGGVNSKAYSSITKEQLFGIEFDREIFALACANMLIHKDGKTNIEHMDTRSEEACKWIASKSITKVLMNPPYEHHNGCMEIVANVLDNVPKHTPCAFILPDKKLEKDGKSKRFGNQILERHRLKTIVKLPEKLLFKVGLSTSIFVFESGVPQDNRNIIGYNIEEDGLETVKNQGRQDIKDRWPELEDYWIRAIQDGVDDKFGTRQIINPKEHLSYQKQKRSPQIYEEDFVKAMTDYEIYCNGVDQASFKEAILAAVMYGGTVSRSDNSINIEITPEHLANKVDVTEWGVYTIGDLMQKLDLKKRKGLKKRADTSLERTEEFNLPLVNAKDGNNGIMYYGRDKDFESASMCIDIVQNGAVATGNVYAQIEKTGVLWDAYLVKPFDNLSEYALQFLAKAMQKMIKQNYSYDDKAVWDKVKLDQIRLPKKTDETPNWEYMDRYMRNIQGRARATLKTLMDIFDNGKA